jgi:uncharacterized protein YxjI
LCGELVHRNLLEKHVEEELSRHEEKRAVTSRDEDYARRLAQLEEDERLAKQFEEEERRISQQQQQQQQQRSQSQQNMSSMHSMTSSQVTNTYHVNPTPYGIQPYYVAPTPAPPPSMTYVVQPPPPPTPTYSYVNDITRYRSSYSSAVRSLKFKENKRYILKTKAWMFGGDMYIKDDTDEEIFRVKGRLISIGAHLTIQDLKRNPLIEIEQSVWMPKMPQFHIFRGRKLCISVKKKNKSKDSSETFSVDDVAHGARLKIVGDWSRYEYEIHRGTGQNAYAIATIARKMWNMIDSYSVEVAAGEDVLTTLALCVVIDRIIHENW